MMTKERLMLSIETVEENIRILESEEPQDAGAYLQLEHEKHILELLEAEAQGRLFISPCKIGDEVWCITRDEGAVYIDPERVVDVSTKGFYISEIPDGTGCDILVPYEEIGKSFFLTRELLEEALGELDGGETNESI